MEIDVLKARQKEKQKGLNTMKITPISRTNFNGYGPKEIQQLTNYAATKQKGAFYDLNKRFSTELISSFVETGKIKVDRALQNWSADKSLQPYFIPETKTLAQKIEADKALIELMKQKGKITLG